MACGGSSGGGAGGGGSTGSAGSGSHAGTSGVGSISEEQFREQVPQLFCQALQNCCAALDLPYDPQVCEAFAMTGSADPSLTFHPEIASECLQQLQNVQCDAMTTPLPCNRAYTGTKQVGDVCGSTSECAVPAEGTTQCGPGLNVCHLTRHGLAGEPCDASCTEIGPGVISCVGSPNAALEPYETVQCHQNEGLRCGVTQVCKPLAAIGESCEMDSQCTLGNFCPHDLNPRVCAPRRQPGEDCGPFSDDCVDTAYCGESASCTARKANGEACSNVGHECQGMCINGVCGDSTDPGPGLLGLICNSP